METWQPLIHPARLWNGVRRSTRLIAGITIAGALIGVLVALSTPRHYVAAADLLIDPREIRLVERELVSTSLPFDAALAIIENQMLLMTSNRVVDRVVEELNLIEDPEFNGKGRQIGLRSLIGSLRMALTGSGQQGGEARQQAVTARNLMRNVTVTRSGRTFIVTVASRSLDPEKSAAIANKFAEVFLHESSALLGNVAGRAAAELNTRLDELRIGVEQAERAVEVFRTEKGLVDARGHLIGDDEIIALNQQLAASRGRTIEAEVRARSLEATDAGAALNGGLPEGISSGVITELRAQYAALTREASQLARTYGPRHPQRRSVEAQLAEAREQIQAELNRIAASIRLELERARGQEEALSQRLEQLKARQAQVADDRVRLRDLEREAAAKRAVYESFLLRATETGEQQELNATNISIISEARVPLDPSGRSRSVIAMAGTALGLFAGIGLAILLALSREWRGSSPPPTSGPEDRQPSARRWRHVGPDVREQDASLVATAHPSGWSSSRDRGDFTHKSPRQEPSAERSKEEILTDLRQVRHALSALARRGDSPERSTASR